MSVKLHNKPVPQPFALYNGDLASTSAGAGVATTAYLVAVVLYAPAVLTSVRVRFSVGGNGHYDVGIYDASGANGAPGTLLAHAAATASSLATAAGNQSPALIGGNLQLAPGRYWLALWIDNATDTFTKANGISGMIDVQSGTIAGPLPASASSLAGLGNAALKPLLIGLIQGGWS